MVDSLFLAMTAQELASTASLPPQIAWLSCHLDPEGTGLTGLPTHLPQGSMVLLDDSILPKDHDIRKICHQLSQMIEVLAPSALLLDFQRPWDPFLADLARKLDALPCPVAVTPPYASGSKAPVFLPPVPPHRSPKEHLAPWSGRPIYLELALDASVLTITKTGCQVQTLPRPQETDYPHQETELHCHYRIDHDPDQLRFSLARTPGDLPHLLKALQALEVTALVGLYQELYDIIT